MASDISPSAYRGLLIHDERIKTSAITATDHSTAPSDYTQAGPIPGVALSQDSPRSNMTFNTSGSQSASKQLRLRSGRGGYPTGDTSDGGLQWRYEGDTYWRGWNPYHIPSGSEIIVYNTNALTAEAGQSCMLALKNGSVLMVHHSAVTGSADDVVRVRGMTPGSAWSGLATITPSVRHADLYPALLQLPDESVVVFFWIVDTARSRAQVQAYRSTDNGANWSLYSSQALVTELNTSTYTLGKLRAAYSNGQVLLVGSVDSGTPRLVQYASDDNGVSFSQVEIWSSIQGEDFEVVGTSEGFVVGYYDNGATDILAHRLSSAFQPSSGVTAITVTLTGQARTTMFVDDDRTIYFIQGPDMVVLRSKDNGATWEQLDDSASFANRGIWDTETSGIVPHDYSGCAVQGRAVIACQLSSSGSSTIDNDSIVIIYTGGSTTVTMPPYTAFARDTRIVTFDRAWFPLEFFGDYTGWTRTAGGSPTEAFSADGVTVSCNSSSTLYWEDTLAASVIRPLLVLMELEINGGGSLSSNVITLTLRMANGTNDYEVAVRFATTGFRAVDTNNSNSTIGTDVTATLTGGFQILCGLDAGKFSCWYRLISSSTSTDAVWIPGPTGSVVNDTSSPNSAGLLRWGHTSAPVVSSSTTWRMLGSGFVDDNGTGLGNGQTNPTDVFPRPISRYPIGIDDGVKVAAVDGPCAEGEVWNIDTAYQYPVEAIDPAVSPSPARKWRSTDETQHDIVWDVSGLSGANTRLGTTTWALYLAGINFRTGSLSGITHSGSATTLMSFDAAHGKTGLAYTRVGDVIKVNTGTSTDADHYIARNEFAGGTLALDTNKYRRITRHTGGSYTDETTVRPEFFCDTMDGTEDASGTLELWAPRLLIILHNVGEYRWLRLRINAQTTADGYFEIGQALLGPIAIFGRQYSRGRVLSRQPNTTLTTRRNGSRVSRREGASRRSVQVAWREGVDSYSIFPNPPTTNPVPDYLTGTTTGGAEPIATPFDTAFKMDALVDELNGSDRPVVYLPTVPRGTPDTLHHLHLHESLYGRVVTASRLENVVGDEGMGEVLRIGSVTIEEEL
jgi:hypothetical protein